MYPFKEGSFAPRNGWYVAAHTGEVSREPLGRMIVGEQVVLYRREDGVAVAVGGRCPHRHYPLACGTLRGDSIVCGYHGIAFDPDGRCISVPSQTAVPNAVRIPSHPLVERGLWLFVWMGDAEQADETLLPSLADLWLEEPNVVARALFVDEVNARYQLLNDNLLDLTHVGFLHASTVGTPEDATAEEWHAKKPGLLSCRRLTRNSPPPPVVKQSGLATGLIDREFAMHFYLPGLHAGYAKLLYPASHPKHAGETINVTRFYHAITPVTPTTSRYLFSVALDAAADFDEMEGVTRRINDEDISAVERVEKLLQSMVQPPRDLLLRADRNAVEGRRMLQDMMDRERELATV